MCFKATPKTKLIAPDHASSVSHTNVVRFCSPAVARTSHSAISMTAAAEVPSVGLLTSALGNPQFSKSPCAGVLRQFRNTGLSMELSGIALSPSQQIEQSPHPVMKAVKHCLDFEESDSCVRSPKIPRKCFCVRPSEPDVSELSADNHAESCKSPSTVEVNSDKGRLRGNVVNASTPVTESRGLPTATPDVQRSQKFLVSLTHQQWEIRISVSLLVHVCAE